MQTWVQRFPGRLEHELDAFRERGLAVELDERSLELQGRVTLRGSIEWRGEPVALEVVYPDSFPYLRPQVYAPDLALDRHQNPYGGNLCLLDQSPGAWVPEDTAAWLVSERVSHLLELVDAGGETLRSGEAPQGEPVSAYFPWLQGAVIFVPAEALAVDIGATSGSGRILCRVDEPPRLRLRGLIGELIVKTRKRKVRTVASADPALAAHFRGNEVPFRWVRLDRPPATASAEGVLAAAEAAHPGIVDSPGHGAADGRLSICGVVFEEEVHQGVYEDAWLFAVRACRPNGDEIPPYLIHSERLTPEDMGARIPTVAGLADKTVAVVGVGALGSTIALELARAQVGELRLLDHDRVETGTTVRWAAGLSAVGRLKVDVLGERIEADHPFTRFVPFRHQIGQSALVRTGRRETELDVVRRLLDRVDLVIDASADISVQQFVASMAEAHGVPQLFVSATEGAGGGLVAPVIPGAGGCWLCLQWHLKTGSLPIPPRADMGTVQPRGCGSPTFTGTSFDLLPIAAQASRVAASMLGGRSNGEVSVCSIPLSCDGSPPAWESRPLTRHQRCPACSAVAAA